MTSKSNKDVEPTFMDRVLDRMEELASKVTSMKAENVEVQDGYSKLKEELDELKVQYEYT